MKSIQRLFFLRSINKNLPCWIQPYLFWIYYKSLQVSEARALLTIDCNLPQCHKILLYSLLIIRLVIIKHHVHNHKHVAVSTLVIKPSSFFSLNGTYFHFLLCTLHLSLIYPPCAQPLSMFANSPSSPLLLIFVIFTFLRYDYKKLFLYYARRTVHNLILRAFYRLA